MSCDDIAKALGRTRMWARWACDAALHREQTAEHRVTGRQLQPLPPCLTGAI